MLVRILLTLFCKVALDIVKMSKSISSDYRMLLKKSVNCIRLLKNKAFYPVFLQAASRKGDEIILYLIEWFSLLNEACFFFFDSLS